MHMQQAWILEPMRSWSVSKEGIQPSWCVRLGATPLTCKPLGRGWKNTEWRRLRWKAPGCIGYRCSKNWRGEGFIAISLARGLCGECLGAKVIWWTANGSRLCTRMDYWKVRFGPKQIWLPCEPCCAIVPT